MTGLLLPRTPGGMAARQQLDQIRAEKAADTIQQSSKTKLASDEFLTEDDIGEQLQRLYEYIEFDTGRLPKPVGWRISFLILTPPEKTSGGVMMPADTTEEYSHKSVQGIVLDIGETAYKDTDRFPVGPWVKKGDRLVYKRYDAQVFELANGQKIGILNDTQPIAVLRDTEGETGNE